MKLAVFLTSALLGFNAMACDELVGTWQCKDNDGEVQTVKYEKQNGVIVSTNTSANGEVGAPIIWDGQEHQQEGMAYRGSVECKGQNGTFNAEFAAVVADDQGNQYLVNGLAVASYQATATTLNSTTQSRTVISADGQIVSDETSSSSQACVKK